LLLCFFWTKGAQRTKEAVCEQLNPRTCLEHCVGLLRWPFGRASLVQAHNGPSFEGRTAQACPSPPIRQLSFGSASNLIWKVDLAPGMSSPCVWGGRIFVTTFAGRKLETVCLDAQDGTVVWRRAAPATAIEEVNPGSSPASSTPARRAARVFVPWLLRFDFLRLEPSGSLALGRIPHRSFHGSGGVETRKNLVVASGGTGSVICSAWSPSCGAIVATTVQAPPANASFC
jgi:hypothetical protein